MKRILTERDRREIRKALWERYCKHVSAPRKVRLLFLQQLYNDWYAAFRRQEASTNVQPILHSAAVTLQHAAVATNLSGPATATEPAVNAVAGGGPAEPPASQIP